MAVDIDLKYGWLQNPEDCPIEELEEQIRQLNQKVGFYETQQLAVKKFINSVYGALGCKFFVAYSLPMAESITGQGRDLNHYSEICVNEYFEGLFQQNPEITVYYQWVHTDPTGRRYTYKSEEKPVDYYDYGTWEECQKWESAVKKGQQLLISDISSLVNNKDSQKDWFKIKTNLWDKMCLIHEKCRTFDISKGKTTDHGPLDPKEYDWLEGRTESMIIGGDTDSIYVEGGRIISWCAPKSIYWGVSEKTQRDVLKLCKKYPEKLQDIPNIDLRKRVHEERAFFETQAIVDMWNYSMGPYMERKYEEYAEKYNCDKNLQVLEMEKISDVTMYFAKKMYAMSECWKEPGIFLPYMEDIIYKGIEIVRGGTPSYVRECMEDFVNYSVRWYGDYHESPPFDVLVDKLKNYKKVFMTKTPDEICKGSAVNNYEKWIVNDKKVLEYVTGTPVQVRAAAVYNFILNQEDNAKYRAKYQFIQSADKIKWYYSTDRKYEVFAYSSGSFPAEFAPPIDRELQFEKTLLTFCNKVLYILGYQPVNSTLCYSSALF